MILQPVQPKLLYTQFPFKQKDTTIPYIQATGNINTDKNVKPLAGQGHLVHDTLIGKTKYIFKDKAYSLQAVADGIKGTANDHKLGRINDFGLRLAGISIATYLASRTNDPRAKAMEFVGLLTFLLSMDLYPKLVINLPARIVHGFDIDKQYIDDQGRKKSVFQDSNYIPYDLYRGETNEEDLDKIGDQMNIPRDITNRHEVIKEKMRKVATQNNTLWMLTAGFATPTISALACYGLEGITGSIIEKIQNHSANVAINNSLKLTQNMPTDIASISENSLSKKVKDILSKFEGKEIQKEELDKVISLISSNLDNSIAENIEKDINHLLKNTDSLNKEELQITLTQLEGNLLKIQNGKNKYKSLIPNIEEVMNKISTDASQENVLKSMREILQGKTLDGKNNEVMDMLRQDILKEFKSLLPAQNKKIISKESIDKISDLAKIIGDFKEKFAILDKCSAKKFAYAPETILARSYENFTKILFKELNFSYKELRKMRDSDAYTQELLNKKLEKLCQNETKYKKAMKKLGKSLSDMEIKLNGSSADKSFIKDLITSYENLYNNTAKRLEKTGATNTTDILVKEDISTLKNSIGSISELFDFMDGTSANIMQPLTMKGDWGNFTQEEKELYKNYQANGLGSAKRLEINTMVERYQGTKNTFNRILHTLDIYKTATTPEVFSNNEELIAKAKEVLLGATSSDYTMKLGTNNNPRLYKDLMSKLFENESDKEFWSTQAKGRVTQSTKDALSKFDSVEKGNILTRFQKYITHFRNIIGNNMTDFTKPEHILNEYISKHYQKDAQTDLARYNLIGKNVKDVVKEYADKAYCTKKWFRIVCGIAVSVCGVALLTQFNFGRINHSDNKKRQVKNA